MSLRSYVSAALLLAGAALGQRSCNGSPELCGRKYSNVTFVGAHDSAFVGFLPVHNQYLPLDRQMALGVRFLQSQTRKKDGGIEMCHTSCIELDAGSFADYVKPVKTFLDANPNEVITMLVTNPESIAVEKYGDAFKAAGLDGYAFTPDSKLAMGDWPTLEQMIDSGKRLVVFMDYHSDTSKVPYILDEFAYYFETPWGWTDPAFAQCDLDRPDGASPDGRMYIVNHMLNVELDILGFKILIPDQEHAEQTNSVMSIIAQSDLCIAKYGRTPNVVLLDWVNRGDAMGSQRMLNNL